MSQLFECPSPEKLALFWENRLSPEDRKEILLHIADCNECAMAGTVFASIMDAGEAAHSQCPPPDVFARLLGNKLDKAKRADVLLHVADCDECAMAYSIAREMQKAPIEKIAKIAKAKPVLFTLRYFSNAAAILLLVGASFVGGLYSHSVFFPIDPAENGHARIVQNFESSPLYWSRLNDLVRQGAELTQDTRILVTRGAPVVPSVVVPSVQEILTLKEDFDRRLNEIISLSGQDIGTILSVDGLDIPAMTPSDIKIYAALLKDGRVQELQKAKEWLRLDQSAYLSLIGGHFGQLPAEVWERYPVSEESLKTLTWIAGLPDEEKERVLALSPEEALCERRRVDSTRSAFHQSKPRSVR